MHFLGSASSSWPSASMRADVDKFYRGLKLQDRGRRQSRYQYKYYQDGVDAVSG